MNTPTMLAVLMPFSKIFLSQICPIHCSFPLFHIIFPLPFEIIARGIIIHLSISMFEVIFEISLENTATFENNFSLSLFFPLFPFSFVSCFINLIIPKTMSKPIFNFSFINTPIWPRINTFPSDAIVSELPLIYYSVCPHELSFSA